MEIARKCTVVECSQPMRANGLCDKHLKRWQRHGHTHDTRDSDWGARERHPLYKLWHWLERRYSRELAPEWRDLWTFVRDVGERPSMAHTLRRKDTSQPYSKDNCYWCEKAHSVHGPEYKDQAKRYQKEWRVANKRKAHHSMLRRFYGIGIEDFERMYADQDGQCAICLNGETSVDPFTKKVRRLSVDHCHSSGTVRGLLCSKCNQILGQAKDDVAVLYSAIAYLKRHSPS